MLIYFSKTIKTMKGKKNDFSMSFFNGDDRVMFLEFVHRTETATEWMNAKGKEWTHANIYNRRTREFIQRVYNTEK